MNEDIRLVEVTAHNVEEAGICCSKNKKSEGFKAKVEWFKMKINEGLKIVLALDASNKQVAFIEYLPSENAWRPVKASNYLFIQCIAVYVKDLRSEGIASRLLQHCENEAKEKGKAGICVITSSGPWLAGKELFLNNGFYQAAKIDRFELMVKQLQPSIEPVLINWMGNQWQYKGWNLIYADQCPWHSKSVTDLKNWSIKAGFELKVTRLNSPQEAQSSASGFGTFALIKDGKLLADHYISETRFKSIIKQELI